MIKKIVFIIISTLIFIQSEAQIYNIHNFYTQNMFYYAPAHTGDKEQFAAFADYRNLLTGIKDALQTATVGLHSPITSKMNIGGLIKTQRAGLFETVSGRLDYSFRTHITDNQVLALGINGGVMQRNLNVDNAIVADPDDPTLFPDYSKKIIFFAGASFNYRFKNINFDIGIPSIYRSSNLLTTNYFSFLSYDLFSKNRIWQFRPSVLTVYNSSKIFNAHINFLINYENVFWIQPTYKLNGSIVVAAGVNLKKIGIGYAYETNSGALSYIGGASHEIIITYGFFKKRLNKEDTVALNKLNNPRLKGKINGKTYEEYVTSNNYGFYNNIMELTDSVHREEIRKQDSIKAVANQDSIKQALMNQAETDSLNNARIDSLRKVRLDSIAQAKRDSARQHALRHLSDQELKILQKGVHFKLNSAMLTQEARNYLDSVAKLIIKNKNIKVLITGYTCNLGTEKVNLRFSIDRAESVEYYLLRQGVPPDRVSTNAGLDAEPVVPNTNEANRKLNRRVSFSIIKGKP